MSGTTQYNICNPTTLEHRRAIQWFAGLTGNADTMLEHAQKASLQNAIEFYKVFAETGDERYLKMCEQFLKVSLG